MAFGDTFGKTRMANTPPRSSTSPHIVFEDTLKSLCEKRNLNHRNIRTTSSKRDTDENGSLTEFGSPFFAQPLKLELRTLASRCLLSFETFVCLVSLGIVQNV